MIKSIIAIIFSILFTSMSIVPNIIASIDDDYDISILIDTNEEEEKKGEEKVKDFEIEIPTKDAITYNINNAGLDSSLNMHSNNYSSLFKEQTSPPPEVNI